MPTLGIEGGRINIVPVDYVVQAMVHIAHKPKLDGMCFHLTDPKPKRIGEVLNLFANAAIGAAGAAATTAIIQDSSDNLGRAAAAGALIGAGADVIAKNQNKEVIVRNCMRGRGYNVVG